MPQPLLWTNKNRVTRLFQIISDLHSSKLAASLLVQTRFPTSLINLFVKNHTHFKKPNSNKPFHRQISDPLSPKTPTFIGCTVVSTESDCSESPSLTQLITDENLPPTNGVVDSGHGVDRVWENNNGSGLKSVLVTFFMMVVIVVSIASFEKLTVGITVSAFVLLFLEYAVKRIVLPFKANVEIKVVAAGSCIIIDSSFFEVIKVEDTSCDDLTLDCVKGDKNSKGNRNVVKLKSKLKKLFSKKLHGYNKEGKEKRVKRIPS
ncbi:ethylene-responsive nuclear protein / ethylene-regulated nuclear protein (ERT2) [Trifolium repens]|nr:ethylene-responsive nuclear protein / ethylene-regulated nuclear protein (ERT2) [Trifolium repens]